MNNPICPECGFELDNDGKYWRCTSWNCGIDRLSKKTLQRVKVKSSKSNGCSKPIRPECGSMAFGEDWPGIFIRGDSAAYYALLLRKLLDDPDSLEPILEKAQLNGLVSLLEGCITFGKGKSECQYMKDFKDCFEKMGETK
jgi:hypothetical protein